MLPRLLWKRICVADSRLTEPGVHTAVNLSGQEKQAASWGSWINGFVQQKRQQMHRHFGIYSVGSVLPLAAYLSDANKPEAYNRQMTGFVYSDPVP
jgi:hypothetical protein